MEGGNGQANRWAQTSVEGAERSTEVCVEGHRGVSKGSWRDPMCTESMEYVQKGAWMVQWGVQKGLDGCIERCAEGCMEGHAE